MKRENQGKHLAYANLERVVVLHYLILHLVPLDVLEIQIKFGAAFPLGRVTEDELGLEAGIEHGPQQSRRVHHHPSLIGSVLPQGSN